MDLPDEQFAPWTCTCAWTEPLYSFLMLIPFAFLVPYKVIRHFRHVNFMFLSCLNKQVFIPPLLIFNFQATDISTATKMNEASPSHEFIMELEQAENLKTSFNLWLH